MQADTKAVRRVLRAFDVYANWTDKSSRLNDRVRIVVGIADEEKCKEVKQAFADIGYTNKVYLTDGMYLRVKTHIS